MTEITITVKITKDQNLIIDLPADTPIGEAEVRVRPVHASITRGEAKELLRAAGLLSEEPIDIPDEYIQIPDKELIRLTQLPPGSKTESERIIEDRGEY